MSASSYQHGVKTHGSPWFLSSGDIFWDSSKTRTTHVIKTESDYSTHPTPPDSQKIGKQPRKENPLESIEEQQEIAPAILKMKNKGGAPLGNRNALKHGRFTAKQRAIRKYERVLRRRVRVFHSDIRAMREEAEMLHAFIASPQ
jgi:uncharacterized protein YjcR